MSRRLPGATESERLTMLTALDDDQCTTRHNPGTLNDVDLGLSKAILQSDPIAVCTSAAATMAKTASLSEESFPDFKLMNGRTVIVYMANGNSASSPTMNIANTGAITMEDASWQAGSFLRLKYVDITVNGTRIQRWLVEAGATNTTAQLNGALTNYALATNVLTKIGTVTANGQKVLQNFVNSTGYKCLLVHVTNGGDQSAILHIVYNRYNPYMILKELSNINMQEFQFNSEGTAYPTDNASTVYTWTCYSFN